MSKNTGMLSSVESLQRENKELSRIIEDISQLISLTKVDSMIDFVITKFLDYFIPENLVFIIKPPRKKHVRQYFYKRLSRADGEFDESVSATIKLTMDKIFDQENSGNIFRYEDILSRRDSMAQVIINELDEKKEALEEKASNRDSGEMTEKEQERYEVYEEEQDELSEVLDNIQCNSVLDPVDYLLD